MKQIINCLAKRFIESLSTMATLEIVKEAVLALKDRTGSSVPAINKWVEAEKNVSSIGHFLALSGFEVRERNIVFFAQNSTTPRYAARDNISQNPLPPPALIPSCSLLTVLPIHHERVCMGEAGRRYGRLHFQGIATPNPVRSCRRWRRRRIICVSGRLSPCNYLQRLT
jgi:hypothetical protein